MNRVFVSKPRINAGSLWGVFAGVIGSFCCLGPSSAVLLGLGSSSVLFSVQFDQTWMLGVSGVLLLGGVLHMRRRSRVGTVCRGRRWRQALVMLATAVVSYGLLGVLLPWLAAQVENTSRSAQIVAAEPGPLVSQQVSTQPPALHRLTLIIEKMNCPPCASKVRNRFQGKPAVRSVRAEAYNEEVVVTYDPQQATGEELMKIIPRQYGVTLLRDEPLP